MHFSCVLCTMHKSNLTTFRFHPRLCIAVQLLLGAAQVRISHILDLQARSRVPPIVYAFRQDRVRRDVMSAKRARRSTYFSLLPPEAVTNIAR